MPAKAEACGLGRERERAGGIGEVRDLDVHLAEPTHCAAGFAA